MAEVLRFPYQGGGTLREFFTECLALGDRGAEIGRRMLALLDGLEAADGPSLRGLTSHMTLGLFPADGSPGVGVSVHGHGPGYLVESAFAESQWVGGHAADVAGAVGLVFAALGFRPGTNLERHAEPSAAPDPAA